MTLPTHAEIIIVGGGIAGCSTAYHLATRVRQFPPSFDTRFQ